MGLRPALSLRPLSNYLTLLRCVVILVPIPLPARENVALPQAHLDSLTIASKPGLGRLQAVNAVAVESTCGTIIYELELGRWLAAPPYIVRCTLPQPIRTRSVPLPLSTLSPPFSIYASMFVRAAAVEDWAGDDAMAGL